MNTTMHKSNDKFMLNKNVKEDNNNNNQNTINNKKNLKIPKSNVTINFDSADLNQQQQQSQLDIERENRLSQKNFFAQ
jgi:hypothetical protein